MPLASPTLASLFTHVLRYGPMSRADLSKQTQLSSATVTRGVRRLLETGYLVEDTDGPIEPALGRPANPLSVAADRTYFIGVKILVDELVGVVTDLGAQVVAQQRRALDDGSPEQVAAAVVMLVRALQDEVAHRRRPVRTVCISVSGDVDRGAGVVRYSPWLDWHDVRLQEMVQRDLGIATVLENDVHALTVGQQWFGSGSGTDSFVLVTVGTGIACGIVIDGSVVRGAYGVAGELGHLPVELAGPVCHCGSQGCLEAICSAGAIAAAAASVTRHPGLTFDEALDLARSGDNPSVAKVFARAGRAMGHAMGAVANLIGPARLVLSGEGLAAYDLYEEHVRAGFSAQAFGAAARCDLVVRPLESVDWARGAAACAITELATTGTFA